MNNHTFVIPAYKESPYLEACIQNLLAQTHKSEIIICTSTPSAYLKNLADKYQLSYLINPLDKGSIAIDWNFALAQAKTKYATIAHQDDIYHPDYTKSLMRHLQKDENVTIAFTNYSDLVNGKLISGSLNKFVKQVLLSPFLIKTNINHPFVKKMVLSFGSPICCPTVTYHKEKISGFKFSDEYVVALDWYAWLQLAKMKGSFLYVNKDLVKHRIHLESETTAQLSNGKRKKEEQQILQIIWGKRLAKIIAYFYAYGHKANNV